MRWDGSEAILQCPPQVITLVRTPRSCTRSVPTWNGTLTLRVTKAGATSAATHCASGTSLTQGSNCGGSCHRPTPPPFSLHRLALRRSMWQSRICPAQQVKLVTARDRRTASPQSRGPGPDRGRGPELVARLAADLVAWFILLEKRSFWQEIQILQKPCLIDTNLCSFGWPRPWPSLLTNRIATREQTALVGLKGGNQVRGIIVTKS